MVLHYREVLLYALMTLKVSFSIHLSIVALNGLAYGIDGGDNSVNTV